METKYAKATNVKRINELIEKGFRLYKAYEGRETEPPTLIFIKD